MDQIARTFVVECFVPGVDDAAVRRAADATAAETRRLDFRGGHVEYLGALLMAVDEVVLHTFRASNPELVRRVSAAAGLPFARIIESLEVTPGTPGPSDRDDLACCQPDADDRERTVPPARAAASS